MTSLVPTSSAHTRSHDWDTYFYKHFQGPERLKTKLIRGLVARLCVSNGKMMNRIQRRSIRSRYFEILRTLKCEEVAADLKHVAKDDAEVKELIVGFVQHPETIFGEARKETPAAEEDSANENGREPMVTQARTFVQIPTMEKGSVDEDGREPMLARARTFKEIVAEIGTTRSRRVKRAMQCAEEGQQLASGDEDSDELSEALSDAGLDVLVTELRPGFCVGTTNLNKANELKSKEDVQGIGSSHANWPERLQYDSSSNPNAPPIELSGSRSKGRVRLVLFQKDHNNQNTTLGGIAKRARKNIGDEQPVSSATEDSLIL